MTSHPIFTNFKQNAEVAIRFTHFVYVPTKIICSRCEILTPGVQSDNKNPHVTLLLGGWAAK